MQVIIRFLMAFILLFVVNTIILAFIPPLATAERSYVNTTADWGNRVRGQATSVGGR